MTKLSNKAKQTPKALWMALALSTAPLSLFAASNIWMSTSSTDLNTASNWSALSVPGSSTDAVFDSSVINVIKDPMATADFSVSTFDFPNDAASFNFTFTDCTLSFSGAGITGYTNATITANNTNNLSTLANQITFNNATSNSPGSASIEVNNASSSSSGTLSVIGNDQLLSAFPFSISDGGEFTVTNSGSSNTNALNGQKIGFITNDQIELGSTFTGGGGVTLVLSNTGVNNASVSGHANQVGYVTGKQFSVTGACNVGNGFSLTATNVGTDSSSGTGSNQVGYIGSSSVYFANTFTAGNSATFSFSNTGTNNSTNTGSNQVGYCMEGMLFGSALTLGDSATFEFSNTGTSSSSDSGSFVGYASGASGAFFQSNGVVTAGNDFSLTVTNTGAASNTGASNQIGVVNQNLAVCNSSFTVADDAIVTISNSGNDSTTGAGSNRVGATSNGGDQLYFFGPVTFGDNAIITISNSGTNSSSGTGSLTGYVDNSQFSSLNPFQAGNSLSLSVTNVGTDNSTGAVNNNVGYVVSPQISMASTCTVGNNATITVSNSGTSTNAASLSTVGFTTNQFQCGVTFSAGSNLTLTATNTASAAGGSSTVGKCSSQMLFASTCSFGDGALITAFNNGSGTVLNSQIWFQNGFSLTSGTGTLQATNEGTVTGHGIYVQGTAPGSANVAVVLEGSSLYVDTSSPGFIIGPFSGDSTSAAQVNVPFTVSTPSSTTSTFAGVISDYPLTSSSLIKAGSGALILSGTNTYTGGTTVSSGALIVDGTIQDVVIDSGSLLSGTGTIGNATVNGAIKGGNPLGTLHVNGTLDLEDGSYFGTLISPGSVSLVAATGNVTIGDSTLVIAFRPGTYHNTSTVILTGGHISGIFTGIDINGRDANFLTANLMYTATEVVLGLQERSVVKHASGGNAVQVAHALDSAIAFNRSKVAYTIEPGPVITGSPTPQLAVVLKSLLPLTTDQGITYALNQLHPAQLKGMTISQENNAVRVRESLSQRMLNDIDAENCAIASSYHKKDTSCCEKDKKRMTAWVSGLGGTLKQNNENDNYGPLTGYRTNTGGVVTGIDALFAEIFYTGALGAYTHSHLHFEDGKGSGNISSGYAGVYLSILGPQLWGNGFLGDVFYANASVIGSWSAYRSDRHIEYGAVDLTAKGNYGGNQLLAHFDTGLNFNLFGLTVRPFDSFDYMTQVERGYAEHNAGEWDLTVTRKNAIMMRNELGLQFAKCYCLCSSRWTVSPKFSWVREVRVKGQTFNVNFTQGGTPFVIHGYFPDRNLFVPGLAVTGFMLEDSLVFDLYYNGEFGGGYSSNSFGGQIGYSF